MASTLITLALLYLAALIIPGPNLLLLTHTAASSSRRAALGVALGITTGTFLWVAVAVFGVQQIFAAVPTLQLALKTVGGAYLLYLAFGMFRTFWLTRGGANVVSDAATESVQVGGANEGQLTHYRRGLFTNLTNPKSLAFWTSVAVVSIDPNATLATRIAAVMMVGVMGFAWHVALAYVFSTAPAQRAYMRAKPVLLLVTGCVMTLFGGRLLFGLRG
jgi:threonine/homoserine/homoserine lactone efflux protein